MPRVKIVFDDEVSAKLQKLAKKSPEMLEDVLWKIASEMKIAVDDQMQKTFKQHTGRMRKSLKYVRTGPFRRRLGVPNLFSVFEGNGVDIFPKDAPLLRWQTDSGDWVSSNWVFIPPRPFFYPTLRRFGVEGKINKIASREADLYIRKNRFFL